MKKRKENYLKKLVSIYKLTLPLVLLMGYNTTKGQETWTLEQCIDTALVHNKKLQINRNNISISEQRRKEAKANLIPKVTANADYKYFVELPTQLMPMNALNPMMPEGQFRDIKFGVPHNINANIQLAMPLYNPNIYGAIANTKIANELMQIEYQKTEEQVLYDVTTIYYNAQILKNRLIFIDSNLVNSEILLQNMELLKSQLLTKSSDVNKVKLQKEQLNTQRDIVYNNYLQLLNALKMNMGVSLEKKLTVVTDIFQPTITDKSSRSSLDVQLINTQNRMLNRELRTLNHSRFLPSLNLIASYGASGFGYDESPDDFLDFYPIGFAGLQLSYPLFNGTVTKRKINQKKLEINNNELQAQLIFDKNEMETENAIRQRFIAQNTIINTDNQIELAKAIYEQTILQQKEGTASLTDVLLADNALREAQQSYLNAIIDFLKADLEFKRITGTIKN